GERERHPPQPAGAAHEEDLIDRVPAQAGLLERPLRPAHERADAPFRAALEVLAAHLDLFQTAAHQARDGDLGDPGEVALGALAGLIEPLAGFEVEPRVVAA